MLVVVVMVVMVLVLMTVGLVVAVFPLPRLHAVVPRGGDLPDAPRDVAGELGHEHDVAVAHDGDGPAGRGLVQAPAHLVRELHEMLGAPIDLAVEGQREKKEITRIGCRCDTTA